MKIVRDINKLIVKKVLEIVFLFFFVFFATFLWRTSGKEYLLASVSGKERLNYTDLQIENPIQYEMYPMRNQEALSRLKPCILTVSNNTYTEESYMLVLRIAKSSSLDYKVLNLSINGVVSSLTDLPRLEETEDYYFVLDQNSMKGSEKKYHVLLWMDASTGNEMQSKSLFMGFEIMNEVTKL